MNGFRIYSGLLLMLGMLSGGCLHAQQPPIQVLEVPASASSDAYDGNYSLLPYLYVLPDSGGRYGIAEVADSGMQAKFAPLDKRQLEPFQPGMYYWIRLSLRSRRPHAEDWMASFNLGEIIHYQQTGDSAWVPLRTGVLLNLRDRHPTTLGGSIPFLPLRLRPDTLTHYYWRVSPGRFLKATYLNAWDSRMAHPAYIIRQRTQVSLFDALVLGMILAVGLYQLAIFFYNPEKQYLALAFQSLAMLFTLAFFRDYTFEYLWPDAAAANYAWIEFPVSFLLIFSLTLFGRIYTTSEIRIQLADRIMLVLVYAYLVFCLIEGVLGGFLPAVRFRFNQEFAGLELLLLLLVNGISIATWVRAARRGNRQARFLLIALVVPIIGLTIQGIINVSSSGGAPGFDMLTAGFAFMELLFAIGVAEKIRELQQQNERAQAEKLETEATQRKLQEKVNEQLRQADRLKDQFLANTSHELRTPLNGIIGLAETLQDGVAGTPSPEMKANLGMIVSSGRRLAALVDDLLDFSKLKDQSLSLRSAPVDVRTLGDMVMRISSHLVGRKPLALRNDIPQDLPLALGDENRIQQILYNLLGNAIKFTPSGEVSIHARVQGAEIEVEVRDTGIGISEDRQQVIFRDFEQGDGSSSREYGGTGLGLSITQKLVELHGGRIRVVSEPGSGSSFFFTLPVSPDQTLQPQAGSWVARLHALEYVPHAAVEEARMEGKPLAEIRILIVDDEPVNIQVLKNYLVNEPYQLFSAGNGPEALDLIRKEGKFDLILLDLMMPRMTGYEVCRRIREEFLPSELPVIMVTAKNQLADLVEGLSIGANDYLPKPFSREELMARIKNQLTLGRIYEVTQRFVPKEFIRTLGYESIMDVQLGDQVLQHMTVMFADIRDFTTLAETLGPEATFQFVNTYMQLMGPVIRSFGGFVIQQYGDGILALFPHKEQALLCSVRMQETLRIYNESRGEQPVRVGIGLHAGPLIMGILGDRHSATATTISDTVNAAARIESLTRHFGVKIMFSETIVAEHKVSAELEYRYLGQVQLKGKRNATSIYECFGGDEPAQRRKKLETLPAFSRALQAYADEGFAETVRLLSEILAQNPDDLPAAFLLRRAEQYLAEGTPINWQGVDVLEFK
ncbi:MAG: response regulator [Bacteroidia bacterium]|nr:response regulator [Bacteroidia bacterium]